MEKFFSVNPRGLEEKPGLDFQARPDFFRPRPDFYSPGLILIPIPSVKPNQNFPNNFLIIWEKTGFLMNLWTNEIPSVHTNITHWTRSEIIATSYLEFLAGLYRNFSYYPNLYEKLSGLKNKIINSWEFISILFKFFLKSVCPRWSRAGHWLKWPKRSKNIYGMFKIIKKDWWEQSLVTGISLKKSFTGQFANISFSFFLCFITLCSGRL